MLTLLLYEIPLPSKAPAVISITMAKMYACSQSLRGTAEQSRFVWPVHGRAGHVHICPMWAESILVVCLRKASWLHVQSSFVAESVGSGLQKTLWTTISDPGFAGGYIEKCQKGGVLAINDVYQANLSDSQRSDET